jgi:hypothetical protein
MLIGLGSDFRSAFWRSNAMDSRRNKFQNLVLSGLRARSACFQLARIELHNRSLIGRQAGCSDWRSKNSLSGCSPQ